jgi:hypothetical protein
MAKRNGTNNTTQKIRDRATRSPLKTGGERRCFGKVNTSCPTSGTMLCEVLYLHLYPSCDNINNNN